jgi:hypothetical protein
MNPKFQPGKISASQRKIAEAYMKKENLNEPIKVPPVQG